MSRLSDVTPLLQRLSYREDLSAEEAQRALNVIGAEERITDEANSDGCFFVALTMALMAKGPTAEELYGLVLSLQQTSLHFEAGIDPAEVIDVSGTGGDKIKTFNVSTAASFVLASGGAYVAKQTTRAYTGPSGSADIFARLGFDVMACSDLELVKSSLTEVGLSAFHPPALSPALKQRASFLRKLQRIGLTYLTPWHLIAWVPTPIPMNSRLYGVFDASYLPILGDVFRRLGLTRALVVHGEGGLDEISNLGPTLICELREGELIERRVEPRDLGVATADPDRVRAGDRRDSLRSVLAVLLGHDKGAKRDLVAINAGAGFYAMGKADSLRRGTELAMERLESGAAARKLEEFVGFHGAYEVLDQLRAEFGLA